MTKLSIRQQLSRTQIHLNSLRIRVSRCSTTNSKIHKVQWLLHNLYQIMAKLMANNSEENLRSKKVEFHR